MGVSGLISGVNGAFQLSAMPAPEPGRRFRVEIPAGSPLFAGHFPGQPILPGVAHLALVASALGTGSTPALFAEIRSLKLRKPVEPGAVLELQIGEVSPEGVVRFEMGVSQGIVRLAEMAEPEGRQGLQGLSESASLESLPSRPVALPHAPPARLVTGVLAASPERVVCRAEIPLDHPLVWGETAPAYLGLEAGAQAAAAWGALAAEESQEGPRIGYVVAIRNARFHVPGLTAGRPFRVEVRPAGSVPPLSIYEVSVETGGEELLAGTVSTYLP